MTTDNTAMGSRKQEPFNMNIRVETGSIFPRTEYVVPASTIKKSVPGVYYDVTTDRRIVHIQLLLEHIRKRAVCVSCGVYKRLNRRQQQC